MRSYNLFRLKSDEGLCCAVPESHVVPRFVTGGRWSFGGKVDEHAVGTPGFDGKAAATSVRFNGFYLFQAMDRPAN
ncbi:MULTISPECIES: hypothetical protein [Methylobacterium]|uniref:Uncharacterized protein n=1 Tax=Methylobacterium thuringiense TaxID=1003091 RepID=A0ABQ4TMG8_9HYPH|nr:MULTISPECIES: hypothetical protein [Methylobacterium]TXN21910.1 hypothetical protein FV217_12585 [Methylobacterium sp. WL9]GJE55282.1 hypothetical protein EKPJFOCH_1772 [Methylobacterium thuringiense]